MTGAEHYRAAEAAISEAQRLAARSGEPDVRHNQDRLADVKASVMAALAGAQVHATLALAAATAYAADSDYIPGYGI